MNISKEIMGDEKEVQERYNNNIATEEIFCTNEYGFIIDKYSNQVSSPNYKVQWYTLMEKYGDDVERYKKSKKVQKLIKRGIPISLKYKLWKVFVYRKFYYDYEELISRKNEYYHQIHVDVQRTFRRHFLFNKAYGRGQSELFNILVAFSNYMPTIGYCQGMSNFAGILLMYFPEEEAFEMLVNIIKINKLETLFDKSLSKINGIQETQLEILKKNNSEVLNHLMTNNIDISVYAISWYLTLFTRFEISCVLRIWDFFLYLDFTIFLYFTSSILKFYAPVILELRGEQLFEFMSKIDTLDLDIDYIIDKTVEMLTKVDYSYYKKKINKN